MLTAQAPALLAVAAIVFAAQGYSPPLGLQPLRIQSSTVNPVSFRFEQQRRVKLDLLWQEYSGWGARKSPRPQCHPFDALGEA